MVRILPSFITLAVAAASMVAAVPKESSAADKAAYEAKRESVISKLEPEAQAYIRSLSPDEYTIDMHEVGDDSELEKRVESGDYFEKCVNGQFAHTMDDGPFTWHDQIGRDFKDAGHDVTFFVNGYNFDCAYHKPYVKYMRRNLKRGHQFCSHTWSHPHSTQISDDEFRKQIGLVETMLLKTIGVKPKCFRFPYGEGDDAKKAILKQKGYYIIQWDRDVGDGNNWPVSKSNKVVDRLKPGKGHILLSHETHDTTANKVIPHAIKHYKDVGIQSKTVHECIGAKGSPYQIHVKPKKRNDSWTCDGKPKPGDA